MGKARPGVVILWENRSGGNFMGKARPVAFSRAAIPHHGHIGLKNLGDSYSRFCRALVDASFLDSIGVFPNPIPNLSHTGYNLTTSGQSSLIYSAGSGGLTLVLLGNLVETEKMIFGEIGFMV